MAEDQSSQQSGPQSYPPQYEEDEINLIDSLRVLWKWKWLIVAGTLICAITAAVISLQMPKIYEISTVIEPGISGVKDSGEFVYIDSATNISGKIDGGVYNKKVVYALQLDPLETRVEFRSVVVKKTDMIKVTSQWQEGNTDIGVKAIREIIELLSDDYGKIVGHRKGDYDEQIKLKLNSIENMQDEVKLQRATLISIRQRKGELIEEIKDVKANAKKIVQQRDALLKDNIPGKELSLLLYSTTIQQNVAYTNQLTDQSYILDGKENEKENEIEKLLKKVDDTRAQINTLNLGKGLISNIKVIQEPEVSLHPIKPKKKQIVLLAGFVSLFMFIFLAFFIEYIRNASKEGQRNK